MMIENRKAILSLLLVGSLATPLWSQLITLPPAGDAPGMSDDAATPTGPAALQSLQGRVAAMLANNDYDPINRLADRARNEKARSNGGGWRIRQIYTGLSGPRASATGYDDTITRLQAWIAAEPENITPRVALAQAYTRYAWVARGSGSGDSISTENYRLFTKRITLAHQTLDAALNLKHLCPQWFSEMQTVALAEDWEPARTEKLFASAVRYEPEYFYFYQAYANYLLPKWDGKPGQAAEFAKTSADKIGGEQGDFIYFRIGTVLLSTSNNNFKPTQLDWERLQRGHAASVKLYGATNSDTNELALMAWRFRDITVATPLYAEIGDKWSHAIWKTRERFDNARNWAIANAPR